jgi:hypothetical protein
MLKTSRGQRAESREQRAKSKEQKAEQSLENREWSEERIGKRKREGVRETGCLC